MKTTLLWTLALFMLAAPGAAEAITVSITATRVGPTPGTATVTPTVTFTDGAGNPAVALACTSNVSGVANSTRGNTACTRTILVGGTTVTIRDVSTTNRARVYRVDGLSSDILNLAGLLATSGSAITATSKVTLKINYASALNEFTPLNYNLYAYTAAMSGNFFRSTGAAATACGTPTTPPFCLTLRLNANNVIVNQFGDNAVATVNVHSLPTGGAFGPPTHPSETKSIACGTLGVAASCKPSLQGELTAIYNGPTETLKVVGGAAVGGSNNSITTHGVIDTFVDVATPEYTTPVDVFVDYTQEPTLHATLVQDGMRFPNIQQGGDTVLSWNLDKVEFTPLNPDLTTRLRSIVSNDDLFDDGAYVTWVPTQGQVQARDLSSLVVNFTGDCSSNSLFVEIQLETLQVIRIPLCGLSGLNLVTVGGPTVQLPDNSFTTYKSMLTQFGGVDIRAISVLLTKADVDQEIDLTSFTIGAFKTTFERAGGRLPTFLDLKCDFPGLNEFTVRVTPVDASLNPVGPSFIWGDGPGETFEQVNVPTDDCQLRTGIHVTEFPPHDRENGWKFELLYNLVPVGQGFVSLF